METLFIRLPRTLARTARVKHYRSIRVLIARTCFFQYKARNINARLVTS